MRSLTYPRFDLEMMVFVLVVTLLRSKQHLVGGWLPGWSAMSRAVAPGSRCNGFRLAHVSAWSW
jgi:hypothetical protein